MSRMKTILLMLMVPFAMFGQSNIETNKFVEANVGLATIDGYSYNTAFPGCSVLYGQTTSFDEAIVVEWEVGLAFPSIATGKVGFGFGNNKNNVMASLRIWPLTFGPQIRIENFVASFEIGNTEELSMEAGFIATIGYRFTIKTKQR